MKRWRLPQPNRRGLTLVELMITISIFGIIMAVVFSFMTQANRSYSDSRDRAQYQQSMRATMSLIAQELRSAGCDPRGVGFESISIAANTVIRCQMDLNGDSDVMDNSPDETVTYAYNAGTDEVWRDDGTGAQAILRGVTNVTFNYFDDQGNALAAVPLNATDRSEVAFVEIALVGETTSGEPVQYQTRVRLRNF